MLASGRLIRKAEDPSNNDITAAYASVVVVNNLNQFTLGTATVGNDLGIIGAYRDGNITSTAS